MADDFSHNIDKWLELREKVADYEKKLEKYRKIIENEMVQSGINELSHKQYTITLTTSTRESLCKKDVPRDIWESYSKASRFRVLRVKKNKENNE